MTCVTNAQTNGPCPNWTYTPGTNRLSTSSGFTYDAAGNVTADGLHTYQWDAEGHIRSIDSGTTASMTFNALGWRVYRTNGTRSYWVDPQGQFLGGYWGQWNAAIPFGGRTLAEDTNGTTGPLYFDHPNALGSEEQWTNWAGSYAGEVQFYPWGAKWGDTTNGNVFQYYASLQLYDPEVDGYQPPNRYEIPRFGRWLTPDPLGGDITNPQSLNRYAYVLNNPTSLTDPLGLQNGCPNANPAGVNAQGQTIYTSCNIEETTQRNLTFGGVVGGYDIFDALEGVPGTYLTVDMFGNIGFGFSYGMWSQYWNQSDLQREGPNNPKYLEALNNQLAANIAALEGEGSFDLSSDKIKAFIARNMEAFDRGKIALEGGNFDFVGSDIFPGMSTSDGCIGQRCDVAGIGTLDFSHNGNSFHIDTGNPYNFLGGGIFSHVGVDLILGNLWYTFIPRVYW